MVSALVFGLVASSSLVLGALVGAYLDPPKPLTGAFVAFATVLGFLFAFVLK